MFKRRVFDALEGTREACSLGGQFCWHPVLPDPAPPLRHAPRPDPPVVCPGFGLDRWTTRTLNKYLVCFHQFPDATVNGEKMTTSQFDIADYFKSACEMFVAETGETLKPASTLFAPEINSEELDHLLNTPGKLTLQRQALSNIM